MICGERISCGSGEAKRVGRRDCKVRSAINTEFIFVNVTAQTYHITGEALLLPSFSVRSSGGEVSASSSKLAGGRREGHELVNHISGNISRFGWTWASERCGEKVVRRELGSRRNAVAARSRWMWDVRTKFERAILLIELMVIDRYDSS